MNNTQQKLAYYLSSYQGDDLVDALESGFDAEELMSMSGDALMSFDGTFKDQRAANRSINLNITGGASNDVLYINPDSGLIETDNGHPISAKGVEGTSMTITTNPGSVERMYRWLQQVPSNCMGIRVTSADPTQLIQNFTITKFDNGPFDNGLDESVITATFMNERDVKENMVTVNRPMFFDRNTRIAYTVLAGKTVTLTLNFGARLDVVRTAQAAVNKALDRKMSGQTKLIIPKPLQSLPGVEGNKKRKFGRY